MTNTPHIYSISPRKKGLSAEECLLRQTGDWRSYVALMNSDAIDAPPFFRKMMNYYEAGIKSFEDIKPEKEGLLVATSVWGSHYISRFLTLCIPSLLEKRNLDALQKKKARIFIHTNVDGRDTICNHPVIAKLINSGILVQVMLLNDDVLEMISAVSNSKYWHLGMTQSMHLQYAKSLNIDYHLMMPDMVYSAGYFERLFALDKPIITHGCISCDQSTMPFDEYKTGLALAIPAKTLMTLALLHVHPRANYHFVKQNKKLPRIHLLIFEGKDEVSIMSPHQSIAYMSKEVIGNIPDRFFFTLDSELDKLAGEKDIYTPCAKDALVMSEVSAENVEIYERKETADVAEYCNVFRQRIPEKSLYKLFMQEMSFPIERTMLSDRWYMEDGEIEGIKEELRSDLCPDAQK